VISEEAACTEETKEKQDEKDRKIAGLLKHIE
jgi:hypothetical protein